MTFNSAIQIAKISTPGTLPSESYLKLYPKEDGEFYILDSDGVERPFVDLGREYITNIPDIEDTIVDVSTRLGVSDTNQDYSLTIEEFIGHAGDLGLLPEGASIFVPGHTHTQAEESAIWTIEHNLDCDKGILQFYDNSTPREVIHPQNVQFNSDTIVATFTAPISGVASFMSTCGTINYIGSLQTGADLTINSLIAVRDTTGEDRKYSLLRLRDLILEHQEPFSFPAILGEDMTAGDWVRFGIVGRFTGSNAQYIPNRIVKNTVSISNTKSVTQIFRANFEEAHNLDLILSLKSEPVTIRVDVYNTADNNVSGSAYVFPTGDPIGYAIFENATSILQWRNAVFNETLSLVGGRHYGLKIYVVGEGSAYIGYVDHVNEAYIHGVSYIQQAPDYNYLPFADIPFVVRVENPLPEENCKIYKASANEEITSNFIGSLKTSKSLGEEGQVFPIVAIIPGLDCGRKYYLGNDVGTMDIQKGLHTKLLGIPLPNDYFLIER